MKKAIQHPNPSFENATGKIDYTMTNDYMFRAILQTNQKVLIGLVCSLLHLKQEQIKSILITNSVALGDSVTDKEFVLDINVVLNNNLSLNLEMQVINQLNWPERSLSYLCRSFDNLCRGTDYLDVMPPCISVFLIFPSLKNIPNSMQLTGC